MKRRLLQLSRLRNRYLLPFDLVIISISPVLALLLRMEGIPEFLRYSQPLIVFIFIQAIAKPVVLYFTGLYSQYWRYASTEELFVLLRATIIIPIVEVFFFFLVMRPFGIISQEFPRSIPFLDGFISVSLIGGLRLCIRLVNSWNLNTRDGSSLKPALVVGAGIAGGMIVREMQANQALGLEPLGYVDDDPDKFGKRIHGVRVLGTLSGLSEIINGHHIAQVVIAMPTAPGKTVRSVVQACKESGVESKIIPGLFEILRGTARVDQFRNIELEDLLRRGVVKTDTTSVVSLLQKKPVMVTGAGGSIGSELCRQISDFGPSDLILLGHGENSIFQIAQELLEHPKPGVTIHSVIADVRDRVRMEQVFAQYAPRVVFHAAAHKHVPLMEENVPEAITNNVQGTLNLVNLCAQFDISRLVMVSSDKAVNPTSVMGASKRVAELIVQETAIREGKPFVVVRFGNVLGSRGSVVPVFKRQIELGGPITVTHPDVKRYFMTIPESVQLVLQAGTMGIGGETFVLDMGEQIKIVDIARDLIRLNGLVEGRDIDITYTGLRPGEKLFEELFYEEDQIEKTEHEKIMVCRPKAGKAAFRHIEKGGIPLRQQVVAGYVGYESPRPLDVKEIIEAARKGSAGMVIRMLKTLVPQFEPPRLRIEMEESAMEEGNIAQDVDMRSRLDGLKKTDRVYLSPPVLDGDEKQLLLEAFASNWITTLGPHVDAFEREMSGKMGVANAVALSSGTAALHLALISLGVRSGDTVFCSDLTFAASAFPITYCGATPVFVDSSTDTWNMDPELLNEALGDAAKVGKLPRAVIVVDLYGQSADYGRISAICQEYGVPMIEDAAEALGATCEGRMCGSFGVIGILSFNGNKIITTSGGGMLLSNTKKISDHTRLLATQARDPVPYYQHSHIGYNYRLSNLLAAVGRGQLRNLEKKVARRREINRFYREALAGLPGLTFMPEATYGRSNCWLTCLTVDSTLFGASNEDIRLFLEQRNIESRHIWKPMHLQPVFAGSKVYGGELSEDLFKRGICLPSGSQLSNEDLDTISSYVRSVHSPSHELTRTEKRPTFNKSISNQQRP